MHGPFAVWRAGTILCGAALTILSLTTVASALTVEQIANLSGPDRQKAILEGARKEGQVMLYTGATSAVLTEFQKRYPFIRVETNQGNAPVHVRRMTEEYAAGRYIVDVVATSNGGLYVLKDKGMLQPFNSPELSKYRPDAIEPGRHWAQSFESFVSLGYNTKEVSPADAPKTLDDLLNPKWRGKLASAATTLPNWIGAVMRDKGDKTEDYLRRLAKQSFRVYKMSGRALANLIVSGEVPLSPSAFSSHIANSKRQGSNVGWRALGGVYANVSSVALAKRPPHPYAAMFYIDFIISREGQILHQKLGYSSGRTDIDNPDQPEKRYYLGDEPNYAADFEKWTLMGTKILGKPQTPDKKK